jgi:hypothetical protein
LENCFFIETAAVKIGVSKSPKSSLNLLPPNHRAAKPIRSTISPSNRYEKSTIRCTNALIARNLSLIRYSFVKTAPESSVRIFPSSFNKAVAFLICLGATAAVLQLKIASAAVPSTNRRRLKAITMRISEINYLPRKARVEFQLHLDYGQLIRLDTC